VVNPRAGKTYANEWPPTNNPCDKPADKRIRMPLETILKGTELQKRQEALKLHNLKLEEV